MTTVTNNPDKTEPFLIEPEDCTLVESSEGEDYGPCRVRVRGRGGF